MPENFVCPRCRTVSQELRDWIHGYCRTCHDYTDMPAIIKRLADATGVPKHAAGRRPADDQPAGSSCDPTGGRSAVTSPRQDSS